MPNPLKRYHMDGWDLGRKLAQSRSSCGFSYPSLKTGRQTCERQITVSQLGFLRWDATSEQGGRALCHTPPSSPVECRFGVRVCLGSWPSCPPRAVWRKRVRSVQGAASGKVCAPSFRRRPTAGEAATINHPLSSAGLKVQQQKEAGNDSSQGNPSTPLRAPRVLRHSDHRRKNDRCRSHIRAFQNIRSRFVDVR